MVPTIMYKQTLGGLTSGLNVWKLYPFLAFIYSRYEHNKNRQIRRICVWKIFRRNNKHVVQQSCTVVWVWIWKKKFKEFRKTLWGEFSRNLKCSCYGSQMMLFQKHFHVSYKEWNSFCLKTLSFSCKNMLWRFIKIFEKPKSAIYVLSWCLPLAHTHQRAFMFIPSELPMNYFNSNFKS